MPEGEWAAWLLIATQEQDYLKVFKKEIWEDLNRNVASNLQTALDAVPYMDEAYKKKLRPYVEKYDEYIKDFDKDNPYGVPIGTGNWAGIGPLLNFGITVCFAHLYYPDIVEKAEVYRAANWLFGCRQLWVPPVPSRCSMATTALTSRSYQATWLPDCCFVSPTTLRTMMTGPSSGDRMRALSQATPSISSSARLSETSWESSLSSGRLFSAKNEVVLT